MTQDEIIRMALEALEGMAADIGKFPNEVPAIAACREAMAQKDEQKPVAWMQEQWSPDCGPWIELRHAEEMFCDKTKWTPLYTAPPKRQPLTDEQRYELIKEHLGLERRRDETVIDRRTGRWTDAARYFDLMDAAIDAVYGIGEAA